MEKNKYFDSYLDLITSIQSMNVEEVTDFLNQNYEVSESFNGKDLSVLKPLDDDLINHIQILEKDNNGILIKDKKTGLHIWLEYQDFINALGSNHPLKIEYDKNYKIQHEFGFYTSKYAEFLLNKDFSDLKIDQGELSDRPPGTRVEYFIDRILISIGIPSPLWSLLFGGEPDYCTIKFSGSLLEDLEVLISQALYIYNSHIESDKNKLTLSRLTHGEQWLIDHPPTIIPKINKNTYKLKKDSKPFLLFFAADDFLGYYRVLEYYFPRARSNELEIKRWNRKLTAVMFAKEIDNIYRKTELTSLNMLVKNIVDETIYQRAVNIRLIDKEDPEILAKKLYNLRNSLVHAKEDEDIVIPSVFYSYSKNDPDLIDIIRLLSINAIKMYGK